MTEIEVLQMIVDQLITIEEGHRALMKEALEDLKTRIDNLIEENV